MVDGTLFWLQFSPSCRLPTIRRNATYTWSDPHSFHPLSTLSDWPQVDPYAASIVVPSTCRCGGCLAQHAERCMLHVCVCVCLGSTSRCMWGSRSDKKASRVLGFSLLWRKTGCLQALQGLLDVGGKVEQQRVCAQVHPVCSPSHSVSYLAGSLHAKEEKGCR